MATMYGKHILLVWQFKSLYTLQNLSVLPRKKRSEERDDALKGFGLLAPPPLCSTIHFLFFLPDACICSLDSLLYLSSTFFFYYTTTTFSPLYATPGYFLSVPPSEKLVHFFPGSCFSLFYNFVYAFFFPLSLSLSLCLVGLLLRVWLLHSRNVKWSWLA